MKTSCVTRGIFEPEQSKVVTATIEQRRLKEPVRANTIIISRMNTPQLVGANALVNLDYPNLFLPDRLWSAKVKETGDARWMAFVTGSNKFRAKLCSLATGTSNSMKNITKSDVLDIKIIAPQKPEQQKIADFLTVIDNRITAIERKLALLKSYKKGVMQQIFTQAVQFKDENGDPYPEWREKRFGDVFDEVKRKVGEAQAETYSITAGAGFVSQRSKFGKDISGSQNKNYTLLRENEFSYNKGNSKTYAYGCVYANKEGRDIAVPSVFISFKLHDKGMSTGFFEQLFISHYLDHYLRQIISSGARMDGLLNVSKSDFFTIKIPVPVPEEQQKIATFLIALDDKIKAEENLLTSAKAWKKGLLQKMFV